MVDPLKGGSYHQPSTDSFQAGNYRKLWKLPPYLISRIQRPAGLSPDPAFRKSTPSRYNKSDTRNRDLPSSSEAWSQNILFF